MKLKTLGYAIVLLSTAVSGQALAGKGKGKWWPFDMTTHRTLTTFAGDPVDGSTSVERTREGIGYTLNTRSVQPGYAYTIWVMTFNNPENCAEPCSCRGVDIGNPDVGVGAFWGTGRVADSNGQLAMEGNALYGELPAGENQVLLAEAIERGAEIKLVLREHGIASADPATLEQQLSAHSLACSGDECFDMLLSTHHGPFCKAPRGHKH